MFYLLPLTIVTAEYTANNFIGKVKINPIKYTFNNLNAWVQTFFNASILFLLTVVRNTEIVVIKGDFNIDLLNDNSILSVMNLSTFLSHILYPSTF